MIEASIFLIQSVPALSVRPATRQRTDNIGWCDHCEWLGGGEGWNRGTLNDLNNHS